MQKPSQKSLRSLDALNVFLADVRDGVGPYLGVYLKASQNWNPAQIGMAISASTIATVIAQTPAGALVDRLAPKAAFDWTCSSIGFPGLYQYGAIS